MDLEQYKRISEERGAAGDYIKFTKSGEMRILRFMHETAKDIRVYYKRWNDLDKRYETSETKTEGSSCKARLNCIEYQRGGKDPKRVVWEFSAHIFMNQILPALLKFPKIKDGVWEITVNNPGSKDISALAFPVMDADTIKYPIVAAEEKGYPPKSTPATQQQPKSKYFDDDDSLPF